MSRILVTGATGFVGTGLVPRLAGEGHQIRAAARQACALPVETYVTGPIGADTDWSRALDGIDALVHLAARVHVTREDAADPMAAFRRVNVAGTARLAEQAEAAGVRRFILVSSVKAAAESSPGRELTEADPPEPRTPYGISKWEGEVALRAAARRMETVILRPPLVYGPGVGANFRALLRLVDSGLPLPFASVRNARSLIARDNLVDAIRVAISASGLAGGTFYVTDDEPPLSTPALIRAFAAALDRPARLFAVPPAILAAAARLAGRSDAAESLLGSLAIDGSAFRAAAGWTAPRAQSQAFHAVAAWWRKVQPRRPRAIA